MEDYQRIADSFAQQTFMATLGAQLVAVEKGQVQIEFAHLPELLQQHGYLHAGVMTSIVDSACGYSALTMIPEGAEVLTVEFKINFLRPAAGKRFLATGKVIKPGRTLIVAEGSVTDLDSGKEIAKMTATLINANQ